MVIYLYFLMFVLLFFFVVFPAVFLGDFLYLRIDFLFFMIGRSLSISIIFLFTVLGVAGQVRSASFLAPFDFTHFLSGNFGELRSNHFHAGLDFKTQGVVGKPIRAVADGSIVRARVQYGGYGRALYVLHDNGYMTVYGHLERFPATVDSLIRVEQYATECYVVDVDFEPGMFKVKHGEVLAWAGNSGYSFGPHLHFELRSRDGEELYNPMFFYKSLFTDTCPPVAQAIAVYPREGAGILCGGAESLACKVVNAAVADTLEAWGKVGFGIKAVDYMSGTHNKYGVYEIELFVDDSLRFSSRMDNVSFSENRLINAWADYTRLSDGKGWFLRSFLLENNPLRALQADAARGWVNICEERLYKVEYRLRDMHGNKGGCSFVVRGVPAELSSLVSQGYHLRWCLTNKVVGWGFSLTIPRGALFEDACVMVRDSVTAKGSPVYILGDKKIPLWSNAKLELEISSHLLPFADKCYIERVAAKGGSSVGGKRSDDGFIVAEISVLDKYAVAVDTLAPVLKPVNEKQWGKKGKVVFTLADKESGLSSYKCYIDGRFVLFEYCSKDKKLACDLKREKVARGVRTLKIVAVDNVGNELVFEKKIKY